MSVALNNAQLFALRRRLAFRKAEHDRALSGNQPILAEMPSRFVSYYEQQIARGSPVAAITLDR